VAVPEGLPLAVTLSLAFATKKMTKVNNLVRHLQSCETMGNATVICSDKTGTLTENIMTVVGGTLGAGGLEFGDKTAAPDGASTPDHDDDDDETLAPGSPSTVTKTPVSPISTAKAPLSPTSAGKASEPASRRQVPASQLAATVCPDFRDLMKDSIALNSTAFEGDDSSGGRSPFVGTKTETALLDFARTRLAMGPLSIERANHHIVQIFPFNSRQKCMGSVIQLADGRYRLLVKGAPEVVLAQCTTTVPEPTCVLSLDTLPDSSKGAISSAVSRYASLSFRTLGFAYRDFDEWPSLQQQEQQPLLEDVFDSMTWLAVVAIQDPVRPGVAAAVRTCHRASVAVKMVTGDNVETARAIARECGILPAEGGGVVMEGAQFRRLSEGERLGRVRELAVLARSSPEDKRVLVKALRALGEVVAVTGDGTNDAPALKAADVGFSMGITGTEVAKEASDIILMDDNFSSIVEALAWGRAINDAVRKFLQFQITVNITAVILTFVSAVASGEERSVLNAVQLLWVNLIMDTFAALALATDPPNDSLFDRSPEKRTASLINLTMWKMIIGQSIYQLAVTLTLHFAGQQLFGYPDAQQRTLVFNVFVFMQIFKLVNSRRIDNKLNIFEGLHKNILFMIMMAIMVIGQIIIIFFAGDAFGVKRLTAAQWGISLVLGFMSIPVGILIRLVPDGWVRKAAHSIPGPWRRRAKRNDVPDLVIEGNGLGDALLDVKDSLAFLKKVRGGRIRALSAVIQGKSSPRSRTPSLSHMRSAVGMPGLLAATVGGLSPLGRGESEGVQVTAVTTAD
jgi:Ca2+-transporting ATPase